MRAPKYQIVITFPFGKHPAKRFDRTNKNQARRDLVNYLKSSPVGSVGGIHDINTGNRIFPKLWYRAESGVIKI